MNKAMGVGVILLLLLCLGAGCKSSNVLSGLNFAPEIYSATFNAATRVLTVNVHDRDGDALTVSLAFPEVLLADATQRSVAGGAGLALFTFSAVNPAVGASGTVTVSVTDGKSAAVTRGVAVSIAPDTTLPVNTPPVIGEIILDADTLSLSIAVSDADGDDVVVSLTEIPGMSVDRTTTTVADGAGAAVFTWASLGEDNGDTTISVTDGRIAQPITLPYTVIIVGILPPSIDSAVWQDHGDGSGALTVTATGAGPGVSIGVSEVAGASVDQLQQDFVTPSATATFTYTESATGAGAGGDVTVTVNTTYMGPTVQTVPIAIAPNTPPVINNVTYVEPELTVDVSDADGDDLQVTVTIPTGLLVDSATATVAGGAGSAVFNWSAEDTAAGGAGTTTLTVSDGRLGQATATQNIDITPEIIINPPGPFDADTLYAFPAATTVGVGDNVTVFIITGEPANDLQFLSSVGFTVESAGTYVANSFNAGIPGGARTDTDGYWGTLGPPAPANGQYLDLGDALMPGPATDIGGGFHRYNFAVVTQGPFAPPAAFSNGVLFSFQLSFSAPGTYHLGFQQNDGSFDQTYYSDQNGANYFWGTLDNSYTVTVE